MDEGRPTYLLPLPETSDPERRVNEEARSAGARGAAHHPDRYPRTPSSHMTGMGKPAWLWVR